MQENSSNQSRFLIAAVLSMVILFTWSYFMTPTKPPADNANTAANTNTNTASASPSPTAAVQTATTAQPRTECEESVAKASPQLCAGAAIIPDSVAARTITVKGPLFEVKIDSKGALATSWIINKNLSPKSEFPVFADGSTDGDKKPLQLISEKALSAEPREIPFRLSTGDAALDLIANESPYTVEGADGDVIDLTATDNRSIEFVHRQDAMFAGVTVPVEVRKKFTFNANSYVSDLAVTVKRNGQPVPNVRLLIGASIGDHAINHHTFYNIESETVAAIDGDIYRQQGNYSFEYDANGVAKPLSNPGTVNWAGVADSYFAMAVIPSQPAQGVEYKASRYDVNTQPFYESIFQWILRNEKTTETRHLVTVLLPITADGSTNKIFTGTKDYFLLNSLSDNLSSSVGREVELTNLINFSNYAFVRWFVRPLSIPVLYALNFFNGLLHNYGLAIIVFTFLFYMLLFPLRWSQSRSFKKASGNAPKMKGIQDKIKDLQKKGVPTDDPRMRALQMEQLKMTKDALPIGGCLPMLLQFPLLMAFYTAVTISLEVRQSSFMWLPDLSAADPWHLLEFAFALSMILSMKFTPQAATVTPEQQMQQKMMTYLMPAMMLWVMWAAPSGLLLYWFFGNLVSFGQQMVINNLNKTNTPPGTEIVDSVPKNAKKVKPKLKTA